MYTVHVHVYMYVHAYMMSYCVGFGEGSRREEIVRFLEAATLLRGVQHHHVLPLLRISVKDNYVSLVVYPLVQYGDMHSVMKLAAEPQHSILPVRCTRM